MIVKWERKVFYTPSLAIIFARIYARRKSIKKIDYRKLIAKKLVKKY